MSKTDNSLPLLAILRFSVPSNSTRTLNATQAYDTASSGITLASATGTLVENSAAVKAEAQASRPAVQLGLQLATGGATVFSDFGAGKEVIAGRGSSTATVSLFEPEVFREVAVKNPLAAGAPNTASFTGSGFWSPQDVDSSNKSKATNSNTVFYGAITVGTGDYKKWQGNYAVFKINTVTGKGVLRIYDA